jgi:hypothetical protein
MGDNGNGVSLPAINTIKAQILISAAHANRRRRLCVAVNEHTAIPGSDVGFKDIIICYLILSP